MRFEDLKKSENVFIDANIFIYNFCGEPIECKDILLKCAKGELIGYTSTSILSEVLHRLMVAEAIQKDYIKDKNPVNKLKKSPAIIKLLSIYNNDVEKITEMNIKILDLTKKIISESAKIRKSEGLLTNDSFVITLMKDLGLRNLVTNDNDFDHIKRLKTKNWGQVNYR